MLLVNLYSSTGRKKYPAGWGEKNKNKFWRKPIKINKIEYSGCLASVKGNEYHHYSFPFPLLTCDGGNNMNVLDALRKDGCIVVNKRLARHIGLDAAIMYSEIASKYEYFADRYQLTEDGYFFNTVDNMEFDTCLSKYEQTKAIKKLVNMRLIKHENRGMPQRRYFKLLHDGEEVRKWLQTLE